MPARGFNIIVYLDDFLIVQDDYSTCLKAQHTLIRLLMELGFSIAWQKVEGPSQDIVFLGVKINSCEMTIGLPQQKISELQALLSLFAVRKRASCKQLQSLAGKLNWACQVIRGGRAYLRAVLDSFAALRKPTHKTRLSPDFMDSISWWQMALKLFPGKYVLLDSTEHCVYLDASDQGSGFVYDADWGYVNWTCDAPEMTDWHINAKETVTAVFAARRWAPSWRNSKVIFHTDNVTARAYIHRGSGRIPFLMPWLKELHWYSVIYNFEISAVWVPGNLNVLPDMISRLDSTVHMRQFLAFLGLFSYWDIYTFVCHMICHVSYSSLNYLFLR
jgi:hypothetical protein